MPTPSRERLSLNAGWHFHPGDIATPLIQGHANTYMNAKAGVAWGAAAPDHDDSEWRVLDLPHDWAVEAPFDPAENVSQGYRPRGIAWYRRHFKLPETDRGRHLELQLDAVATHCTVWVNGIVAHRNRCGYNSSYIDITPFAKYGEDINTIALQVNANVMEGWWYEGAGIYRHTWLVKRNATHIVTDGIFANPVRGTNGAWTLPIEATLANSGREPAEVELNVTLLDPEGKELTRGNAVALIPPLENTTATLAFSVDTPRLWTLEDPALYTVRAELRAAGNLVDAAETHCGFRHFRFDADHGFFLNGKPVKLQGVCCHQDHAGVGVAVPDSIWDFRIGKLKEMGVNAYRCAHNPPAAEFLDACDRHGILVMDENRHFNCAPEYIDQLEWLIKRDRNHPCVILWSVFNEEPMQGNEIGYEMVRRMAAIVKRLDPTRPVTAAMNGGLFNPVNVSQTVDVVGFNYQIESYDRFHAANPGLPVTSSEDTSAFMIRGEFETDPARNLIASYDDDRAPWGATHRAAWKAIAERPYLAGGFIWTGFDYRGEPTPHVWPSAGSFFGCMDLCGFPKTAFFIHQAQWTKKETPVLHLVPHWNWPGREGRPIRVMAITNAETVLLTLNGTPLGEKPVDPYEMVCWEVPYTPGVLEAIAFNAGKEAARVRVETTAAPAALELIPHRADLAGDGLDALPVTVRALDTEVRPVPTANLPVQFEISGPGRIIGLGNGDPNSHDSEKGDRRPLVNGLAQVILQSDKNGAGTLTLRAASAGLKTAEVVIKVRPVPAPAAVPAAPAALGLNGWWRVSPVSAERPDPNQEVTDSDMNTWHHAAPGMTGTFPEDGWVIFRHTFKPFASMRKNGGVIRFDNLAGKAEVWLDKQLAGRKDSEAPAPFEVAMPAGAAEQRVISLLQPVRANQPTGLAGLIFVRAGEK